MGIPGIQTTNPNQQLTISWYLTHTKKEKNTKTFWNPQKIQELIIHHSPSLSVSLSTERTQTPPWCLCLCLCWFAAFVRCRSSLNPSLDTRRFSKSHGPWVWWWKMSSFSDMKVILSRTWQVGNSTTIFKKKETLDPKQSIGSKFYLSHHTFFSTQWFRRSRSSFAPLTRKIHDPRCLLQIPPQIKEMSCHVYIHAYIFHICIKWPILPRPIVTMKPQIWSASRPCLGFRKIACESKRHRRNRKRIPNTQDASMDFYGAFKVTPPSV